MKDMEELREEIYNQVIQNYSELEEEFEGDELQNKISEIVDREINNLTKEEINKIIN